MNRGFLVPPLSRADIRRQAEDVRRLVNRVLGKDEPYFDIVRFMDVMMPEGVPDFVLQICDEDVLGDAHGMTFPEQKLIRIRSDVFERAQAGCGRDRMTMAHELGHYVLHATPGLARRSPSASPAHPRYANSEWQADVFGGELLVGAGHVAPTDSIDAVAKRFGVSLQAAEVQMRALFGQKKTGRNI